jgi:hypothetical protein
MRDETEQDQAPGFSVAAFEVDGTLVGIGEMAIANLSTEWLDVWRGLIDRHGVVFDVNLQGPLSHIRVKCTSTAGAALLLVYSRDRPASSAAVVCGVAAATETQVLTLFADSIREATASVHGDDPAATPFAMIPTLEQRPLLVAVPWPDDLVSDQDRELATELTWHFAGAFIGRQLG